MQKFSQNKIKIITTSQEQIKFLEASYTASVSELSPNASVKLLQELARMHGVYQVTTAEGKVLASLVGNCPLALKVTAMLLRQRSYNASVLARMLERALLSTISDRGLPQQHRFTALMDLAYEFLDSSTYRCSHYLSFFPGSFDSDAAVNVLGLCMVPSGNECLDILVWRSLIEEYMCGNDRRFKFHKLIKTYIIEKVASTRPTNPQLFESMFNTSFQMHYSKYMTSVAQHIQNTEASDAEIYKFKSEAHNVRFLLQLLLDNQLRSEVEAATFAFAYHKRMLPEGHKVYRKMFDIVYPSKRFDFICNVLGRKGCTNVYIKVLHNLYLSTSIIESQSCTVFSCDQLYEISRRLEELRTSIGNSSEAASVMRLINFHNHSCCESHNFSNQAITLFFFTPLIVANIVTCMVRQICDISLATANGLVFFFIVLCCAGVNLQYFFIIASLTLTLPILLYNSFICKVSQFFFIFCLRYTSSSAWVWITPSIMFLLTVFHVARRTRDPLYLILCFLLSCSFTLLWFSANDVTEYFIFFIGIPVVMCDGLNVLNEAEMSILHLSLMSLIWPCILYFRSWFIAYGDVLITLWCIFVFRQELTMSFSGILSIVKY